MEKQSEVKIIGWKLNHGLGIVNAVDLQFDEQNKLIPVLGEVGSGKSTLQNAMKLTTQGGDTLKDKQLYGAIDSEVQLLDGGKNIYIGCKTNKKGGLDYVLYQKDGEGKKIKEPVIDGVKATPATYLKNLQTALTWNMSELMSENPTEQKKVLLSLYKSDLSKLGVVFDKKSDAFVGSILDKIEKAEAVRTEKDVLRKRVGGFANHLQDKGYDVSKPGTLPKRIDISELEAKKNKLQYDIDNISDVAKKEREEKLQELKMQAHEVNIQLREFNSERQVKNAKVKEVNREAIQKHEGNKERKEVVLGNLEALHMNGCIEEGNLNTLRMMVNEMVQFPKSGIVTELPLISFNEAGQCTAREFDDENIQPLLTKLIEYRVRYKDLNESQVEFDTKAKEEELEAVVNDLRGSKQVNEIVDAIDAFNEWQAANIEVLDLKNEYAKLLESVNTGVEGLKIVCDDEMNIYLVYNGYYNPKYFNNLDLEFRKLSSYSTTQKPMICLLIQNYLLSRKDKAMRYLWIDDIPIDSKTKALLNEMGEKLNLTIFVNITGDFSKDSLKDGELLIVGGEIFFK